MKRLVFILISLLLTLPLRGSTYYVHGTEGNNGNDGSTFALAKLDFTAWEGSGLSPGDTIVVKGPVTENGWGIGDSGSDGDPIVIIDSTRYVDGFDPRHPGAFWEIIDNNSQANTMITIAAGEDYITFIGIHFKGGILEQLWVESTCTNIICQQCVFSYTTNGDDHYYHLAVKATSLNLYSCLFIGNNDGTQIGASFRDDGTGAMTINMVNCTFYGNLTVYAAYFAETSGSSSITMKNCLFHSTVNGAAYCIGVKSGAGSSLVDLDYNLYYGPNLSNGEWSYEGNDKSTLAAWQAVVQTSDPDGESHSIEGSDPLLQDAGGACTINASSPAFGVGVATDYTDVGNPSIGYYQPLKSGGAMVIVIE
jgi:hypothetical protein